MKTRFIKYAHDVADIFGLNEAKFEVINHSCIISSHWPASVKLRVHLEEDPVLQMHCLPDTIYPCDTLQADAVIFGVATSSQNETLLNCMLENIWFRDLNIRLMGTYRVSIGRLDGLR